VIVKVVVCERELSGGLLKNAMRFDAPTTSVVSFCKNNDKNALPVQSRAWVWPKKIRRQVKVGLVERF
jgi:hypothetical protein